MKEKTFFAHNTSSSSDECNGHVNNFKRISGDKFQCTNGNRSPNCEIKIDKTNEERAQIRSQMNTKRSQRCLEHNDIIVQSSFNNAPIYSKFAFHQIIHFVVVLLLFAVCSTVNGQQLRETRQITSQNTGESLYESCSLRRFDLNHLNIISWNRKKIVFFLLLSLKSC